jgi:hypothetical protein
MTAAFSGSVVAQVQQAVLPQVAGGWRGVLTVVNWQE